MIKTRMLLSAAAMALATGSVLAQVQPVSPAVAPSAPVLIDQRVPLERADVKAEVIAARQDGSLSRYDADSYVPDPSKMTPLATVDDEPVTPVAVLVVTDETLVPAPGSEGKPVVLSTTVTTATYYPVAVETEQPLTRDEVKADLMQARMNGANDPFNADPYVNSPQPAGQE